MSVPDRFDPKIYSKSFPRFSVNRGKDHQQVDRSESNTLRTRSMPAGLGCGGLQVPCLQATAPRH